MSTLRRFNPVWNIGSGLSEDENDKGVYCDAVEAQETINSLKEDLKVWKARVAELVVMVPCQQCGGKVEIGRQCYAIPTCYSCLPPPPALETI